MNENKLDRIAHLGRLVQQLKDEVASKETALKAAHNKLLRAEVELECLVEDKPLPTVYHRPTGAKPEAEDTIVGKIRGLFSSFPGREMSISAVVDDLKFSTLEMQVIHMTMQRLAKDKFIRRTRRGCYVYDPREVAVPKEEKKVDLQLEGSNLNIPFGRAHR